MTSHLRLRRVSTALLAALTGAGVAAQAAAVPAQAAATSTRGATFSAQAATVSARGAAAPTGRYIVALNPTLGLTADSLGDAAARLVGDRVGDTLAGVSGFTATLTAQDAARIAADPAVTLVEPDRRVHAAGTQLDPRWNLDRIDQRSATLSHTYTPLSAASTVHAYVIDTGVWLTHDQFRGRASSGYDFVDNDSDATDCDGHGTHVAGTIGGRTVGVAKGVRLVGVRVLDCQGGGWTSDVIKGIDWVTAHAKKPAVANMSLGGDPDPLLERALTRSIASGVTYTVAAGNEGANACLSSPARVPAAITVGATASNGRRASFSNYGKCVDLFAPGVGIVSSYPGDYNGDNSMYATMDGTSMASPHVAGAVAMLLAASPALTPAQVTSRLLARATKNVVTSPGNGSPNRLLFTSPPPAAAHIATATLPAAAKGHAYRQQLARSVNLTGAWTLALGTMPSGLSLSRSGVLSGTPAQTGTFKLRVRFTDFVPHAAERTLTLTITP
ncbi:S8 family serine peptidase [Actinoplanes sp. NPDC049265]|uniref:S8 family serine peptidase n=1 Tax=Actinoplanes sp. NPDC049265 TaxID=3363902 RepID=UPI00370F9554